MGMIIVSAVMQTSNAVMTLILEAPVSEWDAVQDTLKVINRG